MFTRFELLSSMFLVLLGVTVVWSQQPLPRSAPEAEGVATPKLIEFIEAADKQVQSMHSFMLVRNGRVVAEAWWSPEAAEKPHVLWSLSKSFTSTAVGLAVADGKLSIDDPVLKFFKDEAPTEPSANLKAMRVRDLLTMSTGHQDEVMLRDKQEWAREFLAHPVPHKPGTHFKYNTPPPTCSLQSFSVLPVKRSSTICSRDCLIRWVSPRRNGMKAPKVFRWVDMVCICAPKTLPSSASYCCSEAMERPTARSSRMDRSSH